MTTAVTPGQRLFVGITGTDLTPATRQLLETVRPGGVVLFARNIDTAVQVQRLTTDLRALLGAELLIGIDQENARVNRLRPILKAVPLIADVKRAKDPGDAAHFGAQIGVALHSLGINLDFAPVLDLELFGADVDNALRDRCWGATAPEVVDWAGAFMEGLQGQGVLACPKHFPGLGGARTDSHEQLPVIDRTAVELWEQDVQPYRALLEQCHAIMVGHGCYPAVDANLPASLSPRIITGWLRERLGFKGLVITDDLEMKSIPNVARAAIAARDAGADMMLVCHTPARILEAHAALGR